MTRLRLPPERIGRPLIVAFCLAFLAGVLGGCEDEDAQRMRACGQVCAGHAARYTMEKSPGAFGGWLPVCRCGAADGGRP